MNFLQAIEECKKGKMVKRPVWEDGIAMFIAKPKSKEDKQYKYSSQSLGKAYIATCHIAACELGGVRKLDDVMANDWEVYK